MTAFFCALFNISAFSIPSAILHLLLSVKSDSSGSRHFFSIYGKVCREGGLFDKFAACLKNNYPHLKPFDLYRRTIHLTKNGDEYEKSL